jgi:hypothetical protein
MSKLWEKISTMGQNAAPEKPEVKENIAQPGDKVMHRASDTHGVVTAVEKIGNVPTLSVECADGRMIRGLDRKEFVFAGEAGYTEPVARTVAAGPDHAGANPVEPMPKIEGEISSESILEKLS